MQQTFNGLGVTSGVRVKLDVGDTNDDLHIHLRLREKKWWSGGVQGFMGKDADTQMGLSGGAVGGAWLPSFYLIALSPFTVSLTELPLNHI